MKTNKLGGAFERERRRTEESKGSVHIEKNLESPFYVANTYEIVLICKLLSS